MHNPHVLIIITTLVVVVVTLGLGYFLSLYGQRGTRRRLEEFEELEAEYLAGLQRVLRR